MRGLKKKTEDVLQVIHHEIPENAAGAGAAPIPAMTYAGHGMTWRKMLRMVAAAEAVGLAALLVASALYGITLFMPALIAALLYVPALFWLPRMTKAGAVYTLVIASLTFLMFGVMFMSWTSFAEWQSWFEVTFATLANLLPIAAIVAAIATLRHRDGDDAAKTPSRVVAVVCGAVVLVSIVGSVAASDATRLPGDITLTAKNIEFSQTHLTAKAGNVAIYLQNKDPFAHNVRIKGYGTSSDAGGRQSIRHVFKSLPAGSYAYFCAIHPDDMKGTLTVT